MYTNYLQIVREEPVPSNPNEKSEFVDFVAEPPTGSVDSFVMKSVSSYFMILHNGSEICFEIVDFWGIFKITVFQILNSFYGVTAYSGGRIGVCLCVHVRARGHVPVSVCLRLPVGVSVCTCICVWK